MNNYAKVVIKGSPISKSNFKLFNISGRAILPYNSGKYHDRYALYEEEIAYIARLQNPGVVIDEAVIAVLKVYYKSSKRHPDTNNITKSIFDGIEKSGLIINDAQVRRLIIEEFYDKEDPRFELELFPESIYQMNYNVSKKIIADEPIKYDPPSNKKPKKQLKQPSCITSRKASLEGSIRCEICGKSVSKNEAITANKGKTLICKKCLTKLF